MHRYCLKLSSLFLLVCMQACTANKAENLPQPSSIANTQKTIPTAAAATSQSSSYKETLNGIDLELVYVEAGKFSMGCTQEQGTTCDKSEQPVHEAFVNAFYIGKYEVTQAQWKAIMGNAPSKFSNCEQCPVEHISWEEAQQFASKLRALTGKNYRLPTETEWEYAARGGNKSKGYRYAGSNSIDLVAWYEANSEKKPHPVGSKQANELGIYDMTGNVWEWCEDIASADYSPENRKIPAAKESNRIYRGGCYLCMDIFSRNAYRNYGDSAKFRFETLGLRIALDPDKPKDK